MQIKRNGLERIGKRLRPAAPANSTETRMPRVQSVHGDNCSCHHCKPHALLAEGRVIL